SGDRVGQWRLRKLPKTSEQPKRFGKWGRRVESRTPANCLPRASRADRERGGSVVLAETTNVRYGRPSECLMLTVPAERGRPCNSRTVTRLALDGTVP